MFSRKDPANRQPSERSAKFRACAFLSETEIAKAEKSSQPVAGFQVKFVATEANAVPDPEAVTGANAILVEVDPASQVFIDRLRALIAKAAPAPVIAALHKPTHEQTRQLLHLGVTDVISLPLKLPDMIVALELAQKQMEKSAAAVKRGRVISFVKSVGGVGTTSIATQAGCLLAQQIALQGREACLIDLDLQFGNAALYLGVNQVLTIADLITAGARADGALLRSVTAKHPSGLLVVSAPREIIPLESVNADQMSDLIDLAVQEFSTVVLDLPLSWTNWTLALVARSDIICLVTELSIPSLRQARRQIDFLEEQGLGNVPLHVIINRYKTGWGQSINLDEAVQVLRKQVSCTIGNDFATMSSAIDQGVPIASIRKKTRLEKDIEALVKNVLSA